MYILHSNIGDWNRQ